MIDEEIKKQLDIIRWKLNQACIAYLESQAK
jgi:hypothetical protein